ncbi:MAG: hypothetical protein ACRDO2_10135 [Nocardioidaceae bacterium]
MSVSDHEQERRFRARLNDPAKQWKLSGLDLEARRRWVDYAEAKDEMFAYTDTRDSPWYVVEADDKRTMRLNLISHLLSLIPYEEIPRKKIKLPPRQKRAYVRPPQQNQNYVPGRYLVGKAGPREPEWSSATPARRTSAMVIRNFTAERSRWVPRMTAACWSSVRWQERHPRSGTSRSTHSAMTQVSLWRVLR